MTFDFDEARSASHAHMIAHLTAPFAGGAVDTELAVDLNGAVEIAFAVREPLLVLAPRQHLEQTGWRVRVVTTPSNGPPVEVELELAPYTEARSFLVAYRPEVDPITRFASPFTVSIELFEGDSVQPIDAASVGTRIEVRLVQGVLGRLTYALGAEKQRIRRASREVLAMRMLATARGDALDRLGAELRVGRFADEIVFESTIANPEGEIIVKPRREPDDELRRRLAIYRPFHLSTRARAEALLNGPGEPGDPNAGPLGEMGLAARMSIVEDDNPFAVAVMVVSAHVSGAAAAQQLARFHTHLRLVRLIEPSADVPAHRFLPAATRAREQALRERLRQTFVFGPNVHVAPMVAAALDRAGRCRTALGVMTAWPVLRAQDPAGGSRYQLGLGVDLALLAPAELDALANAVGSSAWAPATDPETIGLLRSMQPRPASEDPEGAWLLSACGMRTSHRLDATRAYVSPIPALGLAMKVSPAPAFPMSSHVDLEALYHAEGDPGAHALLVQGVATASTAWLDAGGEPWSVVPDASVAGQLAQLVPPSPQAASVLKAGGLATPTNVPSFVVALGSVSPELYHLIELGPTLSSQVLGADTAAIPALQALQKAFGSAGIASLVAVTRPGRVLLVVSVIGLPQVGANLTGHRTAAFRWYVSPIGETGWKIEPYGSRSKAAAHGTGLAALVAVGYARTGRTDPYQFRVDLPSEAALTLPQYELLMNVLEHLCPVGVGVHTFGLRQGHVDADGDGNAAPLPPKLARTFRAFRNRRQLGQTTVDDEPT